jgi:hypothetical protein
MSLLCPKCQSEQVVTRNYARKTGGAIGTIAGGYWWFVGCVERCSPRWDHGWSDPGATRCRLWRHGRCDPRWF